jgi:hypothetical protein
MSLQTLSIDDFDPLIKYSNYGNWNTPDPSSNPSWWNESQAVTGSIWHEGEWHMVPESGEQYKGILP